ncbi:MAG: DinB family protein [Chloroflexi bacterium]|nr:DinB family protein [Chloroflexota bacterium]MBU1749308.1 DinB family protein [Chloroflexota bacterium]MBU1878357.1 DinB family protein [Chloroflexota bacterium]
MTYPDAETLTQSFALTQQVIHLQTEGLTHADSLLQPPFRGNCLNWVLGHIVEGRNRALVALGEPPIWGETETARYQRGAAPITRDKPAQPLEDLLRDLDESQERIATALARLAPGALAQSVQIGQHERSRGGHVAFLHWHETYHTGQLELLRQLAGTNDVVIT